MGQVVWSANFNHHPRKACLGPRRPEQQNISHFSHTNFTLAKFQSNEDSGFGGVFSSGE